MADPSHLPPVGTQRITEIDKLLALLARPLSLLPESDLITLQQNLGVLTDATVPPEQRARVADILYARLSGAVTTLMPSLHQNQLAGPSATKRVVRCLQEALLACAESYRDLAEATLTTQTDLALWRSLRMLGLHLLLGDLIAAPVGLGVWNRLHGAWQTAEKFGVVDNAPIAGTTLRREYVASLLLGAAQPGSLSSRQIALVADYAHRFGATVRMTAVPLTADQNSLFWVDPARDFGPIALVRRSPPPAIAVVWLDCGRLATLASQQLEAIEGGATPKSLDLPEFAGTTAGRLTLRRMIDSWGAPARRRFPRRRQHYRVQLCIGLGNLVRLLREEEAELSNWMVVNESADGYAVMHIAGRSDGLNVGDLVGLRSESTPDWQICLVRWAVSESPVHVELGLQLFSQSGIAVRLTRPLEPPIDAVLLPEVPSVRAYQALAVEPGQLHEQQHGLTMHRRDGAETPSAIKTIAFAERSPRVAILSIAGDAAT